MSRDYDGDVVITRIDDPLKPSRLRVDRADPRARIAAELVNEIVSGRAHPAVTLVDDVLTINGENRRVVYRLGRYDPVGRFYEMEWPD